MPAFAYERVQSGQAMPGVFVASDREAIGRLIAEIVLLATCSEPAEWEGIVLFLPL